MWKFGAVFAVVAGAHAALAEPINIRERGGYVTEGVATIDASPQQVYDLVTDYAHWRDTLTRVSKERGFRPPTEESFAYDVGPEGALYVGSPETVADKIVANLKLLDASRFDLKFGMPGLTHDQLMTTIELYVTPERRALVAVRR